ncbi:MAG: DUF2764 family protein [Candidatus Omnitrophota bacterium]|nr:DUF2764 family protein [Candidatus Omnitrophota bacterium]
MAEYYYLVASLSYLKFGGKPPIGRNEFIEQCRKWLRPADMGSLLSAEAGYQEISPGDIQIMKEWKSFNIGIRKELAEVRKAKKRSEAYKMPENLKRALEQETPLLMERELERIRWGFLEDKSAGQHFDINALILYYLKLQIQERLAGFDKDKGEKFFYEFCEVNYEQAIGQNSSH